MSGPSAAPAAAGSWSRALAEFLCLEAAGGLVLMAAAVLAMVVANSPLAGVRAAVLALPLEVRIGTLGLDKPLLLWINDGLMAVFFYLVGTELKRELLEGHLSDARRAALPALAAVGGMLAPAAVYTAFNAGDAAAVQGWAVPTATDIAFALGVLSLLGDRVPVGLKAFLLSVAIFDDLGAIVVIAAFYTAELSALALAVAAALILALAVLNRSGVTRPAAYILIGVPLWIAVLKSGVHTTLAGVVVAMLVPLGGPDSPARRLEAALHPWVVLGVLPVFAFANAGVTVQGLSAADLLHPVPLGIAAGLVVGKQVGILLFVWLALRLGIASLPDGVGRRQLWGVALLCGIGFTMSLFIATLAFERDATPYLGLERLGILTGSLISGVLGYLVLSTTPAPHASPAPTDRGPDAAP